MDLAVGAVSGRGEGAIDGDFVCVLPLNDFFVGAPVGELVAPFVPFVGVLVGDGVLCTVGEVGALVAPFCDGVLGVVVGDGVLGVMVGDGVLGMVVGDGVLGVVVGDGVLGVMVGDGVIGAAGKVGEFSVGACVG